MLKRIAVERSTRSAGAPRWPSNVAIRPRCALTIPAIDGISTRMTFALRARSRIPRSRGFRAPTGRVHRDHRGPRDRGMTSAEALAHADLVEKPTVSSQISGRGPVRDERPAGSSRTPSRRSMFPVPTPNSTMTRSERSPHMALSVRRNPATFSSAKVIRPATSTSCSKGWSPSSRSSATTSACSACTARAASSAS